MASGIFLVDSVVFPPPFPSMSELLQAYVLISVE